MKALQGCSGGSRHIGVQGIASCSARCTGRVHTARHTMGLGSSKRRAAKAQRDGETAPSQQAQPYSHSVQRFAESAPLGRHASHEQASTSAAPRHAGVLRSDPPAGAQSSSPLLPHCCHQLLTHALPCRCTERKSSLSGSWRRSC